MKMNNTTINRLRIIKILNEEAEKNGAMILPFEIEELKTEIYKRSLFRKALKDESENKTLITPLRRLFSFLKSERGYNYWRDFEREITPLVLKFIRLQSIEIQKTTFKKRQQ